MPDAMIVSTKEKNSEYLKTILSEAYFCDVISCKSAGEARRFFIDNHCDLCVIDSPLQDETGESLSVDISSSGSSIVILLIDSSSFDEVSSQVEDSGVMTISKPVSKSLFWNTIKIARAASTRLGIMREENLKLVRRIEDIRIVDRAKCILISNLSMSESQAHRYIEKQAMDARITRRKVAENILRIYEN